MDRKAIVEIIARFGIELQNRGIRAQRIVLYGSQASGTAHECSDIDVVVISPDFAGKGFWERINLMSDALYAVYAPIEAVAMTPEEWDSGTSMLAEFARNGEVLYAA
jgi:predicted nucleotidyltransferase